MAMSFLSLSLPKTLHFPKTLKHRNLRAASLNFVFINAMSGLVLCMQDDAIGCSAKIRPISSIMRDVICP